MSTDQPQEVPVRVAGELLDSALSASIEVPAGEVVLGPPPQESRHVPSALLLIGVALALLLVRGWRQATPPVAAPSSPAVEPPQDQQEPDSPDDALARMRRKRARPASKPIPLPPHVVATLDRLARERAAEAVGAPPPDEDASDQEVPRPGGIEYWVGR